MFLFKQIGVLAAGIFIGFTFATMMLYPQMQSRYVAGESSGYRIGAQRVVNFLKTNFRQNSEQPSEDPLATLRIKDARIEFIEIDGIRTLKIK